MIILEPGFIDSYEGLATLYFQREEYTKAEEMLLAVLQMYPHQLNTLKNLGNLYYKLRDYEKAVHYLSRARDIQADYQNVASILKKSLENLKKKD